MIIPEDLSGAVLDHLGIAVRSLDAAAGFYAKTLGLPVLHEETVPGEQVRVMMLATGESRVELLEPTSDESVVGRFLTRRGEGLHHVALRVNDLDGRFARMQAQGIRLASEAIKVGAGGHRYFFVHP